MKAHALTYPSDLPTVIATTGKPRLSTGSALQVVLLILAATLPVALITVLTLWAVSIGALEYAAALYWTSGFIFLALMLENENGHQAILAGSGISMMMLAWLSSRVAPEFGVLAGFLLAAWVAAPVVRRLALRAAG